MYSFLPSSLFNARFRFHLIHPHLIIQCKVSFSSSFHPFGGRGGLLYILINYMIFKMRACFLFLFQNEYECGYMLKSIVFWLILPPFSGMVTKSSVKQILFPWLVQGKILHTWTTFCSLFCMPELLPKVGVLLACFLTDTQIFKFINWYLDMTIWI